MSPRTTASFHFAGGLVHRLGEAEVVGAGEELVAAVERARLQQLLGADHAERVEQLGADDVLAALAAVERQVGDARVVAAGEAGDERGVLVVGMRRRVHRAGGRPQPFEGLHEAGDAAAVDGTDLGGRDVTREERRQPRRRRP